MAEDRVAAFIRAVDHYIHYLEHEAGHYAANIEMGQALKAIYDEARASVLVEEETDRTEDSTTRKAGLDHG